MLSHSFPGKTRGRLLLLLVSQLCLFLIVSAELARAAIPDVKLETNQLQQISPVITFVASTNTIEVRGQGAVVRLTDINNALRNKALLEQTGSFEWELRANLRTYELVRLELHGQLAGGDVNCLKMKSDRSGFVTIESSNGQISIRNTKITSWDSQAGTYDTAYQDGSGRANISIKNRTSIYTDNRMDVIDSEVAYLGFFEETAYGISWKVIAEEQSPKPGILGHGLTGTITGSKFHHNYFGVYVWGVGDLVVRDNEFYNNFYYGFDAHTVTQRTVIEDNYSHDNGGHGIIFADRCTSNIIRRNRAINNKGHGIMLHEKSDNNTIADNEVIGNDDGVPLYESSYNTVTGNIIRNNVTGVRLYGRENIHSRNNLFENNEISASSSFGVFMYDAAVANTFRSNRLFNNQDSGIYLKSAAENVFADNEISNNEFGIKLDAVDAKPLSQGNRFQNNIIKDNRQYGIYSFPAEGKNTFTENQLSGNRLGDLRYPEPVLPMVSGSSVLKVVLFVSIIVIAVITAAIVIIRQRAARRRWTPPP